MTANEGGSARMAWMDAIIAADDPDIDVYTVAVGFVLYQHMDRQGHCRPSTRRLAALARCSQRVALERIDRLEKAGYLTVHRRHRAVSTYQAATPRSENSSSAYTGDADQQIPDTQSAETPSAYAETADARTPSDDLRHQRKQMADWRFPSADSEAQSALPASVRTKEPLTTSSRTPATHESRRQKVTGDVLWPEMARRSLDLERQLGRCDIPEGARHREQPWLKAAEENFRTQHEVRARKLRDSIPPDDLERFIYELEPTLSNHGWGPQIAAGMRQWDRLGAFVPPTDEEQEQMALDLAAAKAEVARAIAAGRGNDRLTRQVAS